MLFYAIGSNRFSNSVVCFPTLFPDNQSDFVQCSFLLFSEKGRLEYIECGKSLLKIKYVVTFFAEGQIREL